MLEDARQSLLGFYIALKETPAADTKLDWDNAYAQKFRAAMEDDFDTPAAFAVLHELRRELNRSKSAETAAILKALGGTLGFFQEPPAVFVQGAATSDSAQMDVDALVAERNQSKKSKDFARADAIRKQLDDAGIVLEDKAGGVTEWRRK